MSIKVLAEREVEIRCADCKQVLEATIDKDGDLMVQPCVGCVELLVGARLENRENR